MTIRPILLAVAVLWASMSPALPGHEHDLTEPAPVEGEIVLTDTPFCGFFVVETDQGFSLLRWRGEMEVFAEGDHVRGSLHARGLQTIEHVLEPRLLAAIGPIFTLAQGDDWGVSLRQAQDAYHRWCHPRGNPPVQQTAVAR